MGTAISNIASGEYNPAKWDYEFSGWETYVGAAVTGAIIGGTGGAAYILAPTAGNLAQQALEGDGIDVVELGMTAGLGAVGGKASKGWERFQAKRLASNFAKKTKNEGTVAAKKFLANKLGKATAKQSKVFGTSWRNQIRREVRRGEIGLGIKSGVRFAAALAAFAF